jgi:hypothetical protein
MAAQNAAGGNLANLSQHTQVRTLDPLVDKDNGNRLVQGLMQHLHAQRPYRNLRQGLARHRGRCRPIGIPGQQQRVPHPRRSQQHRGAFSFRSGTESDRETLLQRRTVNQDSTTSHQEPQDVGARANPPPPSYAEGRNNGHLSQRNHGHLSHAPRSKPHRGRVPRAQSQEPGRVVQHKTYVHKNKHQGPGKTNQFKKYHGKGKEKSFDAGKVRFDQDKGKAGSRYQGSSSFKKSYNPPSRTSGPQHPGGSR